MHYEGTDEKRWGEDGSQYLVTGGGDTPSLS